jgi:aspartate ammonia-lyase
MSISLLLAPTGPGSTRIEHDLLGDLPVPAGAYYGVQTARALDNFQITGIPLSHLPNLVRALATASWSFSQKNLQVRSRQPATR